MHVEYSIVICAYNPDERLLSRCLNAISLLDQTNLSSEIIIVDNNSQPSLQSLRYIQEFLDVNKSANLILETRQGLSAARAAGVLKARGKYVVFFDDDNEPYSDYLQSLRKLHSIHPSVAAWGPGNVWVEFIDGVEKNFEDYAKHIFQERHETSDRFGREKEWQGYYPYGTGLCVDHSSLVSYLKGLNKGTFTLTGRNGEKLTSGEDTQIVLSCIANGKSVGVSSDLKINHLIPKKRAEYRELKKLIYGMNISYDLSVIQVFPEHLQSLTSDQNGDFKATFKVFLKYGKAIISGNKVRMLKTIRYISLIQSKYIAKKEPIPKPISWMLNKLLMS